MPVAANPALSKTDFLTLLTTQLRYQDPTSPVDQDAFVSQLSQFSMVESLQELNGAFSQLLKLQEISQGVNLVGKNVDYLDASSGEVKSGRVSEITVQGGRIYALVGEARVDMAQINAVSL